MLTISRRCVSVSQAYHPGQAFLSALWGCRCSACAKASAGLLLYIAPTSLRERALSALAPAGRVGSELGQMTHVRVT